MRTRMTAALAAATLAVGCLVAGTASAASFIYTYSSNDGTEGAFGSLSAYLVSPGEYEATSGTITTAGPLLAGSGSLMPNSNAPDASLSPSGMFSYDDQLLPGQNPLITNPGLLFNVGGQEVNIFSNGPGPGTYQFYVQNGANDLGNFTLTAVAVPEPAAWATLLAGLFGVGVVLRNRKKAQFAPAIG